MAVEIIPGGFLMKKLIATFLITAVCALGAFAGETHAKDGMLVAPGDKAVTIGFDFGLGVNAGFEMAIGKFDVSDFRFTYGAKGLGSVVFLSGGMAYSFGGVGTLHFSWSCIDLPEGLWWIQNIDTFLGVGVGYTGVTVDGLGNYGGVHLITHGGSSYFFKPNMAVTVAGGLGGSYVGLLIKM